MADNNFKGTVEALFTGIDGVVSSKTVVGDAIHIGDTIILPLVDVSFAIGAGAFNADKKEKGAGGVGGKMTPCAVLVIQNGHTRLVNIRTRIRSQRFLIWCLTWFDKFTGGKDSKLDEDDVKDILDSVDVQ